MNYFKTLGTVWYELQSGEKILMPDITKFATIEEKYKNDPRYFLRYDVDPSDRPEILSHRLYGTVEHFWTIFVMNDMYDFEARWPKTDDQLSQYIETKYKGKDAETTIHHYENVDGLITDLLSERIKNNVSLMSDDEVIRQFNITPVTVLEHEEAVNEAKRSIKLIDPSKINYIASRLEELMNV